MDLSSSIKKTKSRDINNIRIPIRLKITLPFLALSILLALAAAYLISQVVFDSLEERYTNQLIESGKLSSEWMVREEDRLLGTLRLLSFTNGIPEILTIRSNRSYPDKNAWNYHRKPGGVCRIPGCQW